MDTNTRAATKIQSVWRMWKCKEYYNHCLDRGYVSETESEEFNRTMDECEAEEEYKYAMHYGYY
jgi:hypothetical protein